MTLPSALANVNAYASSSANRLASLANLANAVGKLIVNNKYEKWRLTQVVCLALVSLRPWEETSLVHKRDAFDV